MREHSSFVVSTCRAVDDAVWHRVTTLDRLVGASDRCFGLAKMLLPMWCPSGAFTSGGRVKGSLPDPHSGLLVADFDPPNKDDPPDLDAVWNAALALRERAEVVAAWPSASDTGLHVVLRARPRIVSADDHKRVWHGSVPLWFNSLHPKFRSTWTLDAAFSAVNQRAFLPYVADELRAVRVDAHPLPYQPPPPPTPVTNPPSGAPSGGVSANATPEDFACVVGRTGWVEGRNYPCPLGHANPTSELFFDRYPSTGDLYARCAGKHRDLGALNLKMWMNYFGVGVTR